MNMFTEVCGAVSLKKGSIIIGIYEVIFSVIGIIGNLKVFSHPHDDALFVTSMVSVVLDFAMLGTSLLLIYGSLHDRRYFLIPWLIVSGVAIILICLLALGVKFSMLMFIHSSTAGAGFALVGYIAVIIISICIYLWWCVFSHYHMLTVAAVPGAIRMADSKLEGTTTLPYEEFGRNPSEA